MVDLGEWREGIRYDDLDKYILEILGLKNIDLIGIGVTFTCINGVIADCKNLSRLSSIAEEIRNKYGIKINIVSGGNSSSYYLVESKELPKGINSLRLGEVLLLGRESSFGKQIEKMNGDIFKLYGEIVEIKTKPTLPIGEVGMDAFGRKPHVEDKGERVKALLAIGAQDVNIENIIPTDPNVHIFGSSSDYISVDLTECRGKYKLGDCIEFNLNYGAIMEIFTSKYIKKIVRR